MGKSKTASFSEYKLKKTADENFEAVKKYQQNPIKAKFAAFQKTKKSINPKDLF